MTEAGWGRRGWLLSALLFAAALGLRMWNLGGPGLWADEAYTALVSSQNLSGVLRAMRTDDAPPLFYLIEKGALALLGDSEAAIRFLPALCGSLAVAVAFATLRRYEPRAALPGLIVSGFSTGAIFYSQQGRNYSLLHLLTVLALFSVLRLQARPGPARAGAVALIGLALLYTHSVGLWITGAAAALSLLAILRRPGQSQPDWRAVGVLVGILGLGALPWAYQILDKLAFSRETNEWMSAWWQTRPLALAPLYSAALFINGAAAVINPPVPFPALGVSAAAPLGVIVASLRVLMMAAVGLGLFTAVRRGGWLAWVLATFTAVPLVGLQLTHLFLGPAYVLGRSDTLSLFPFCLLVALGWSQIRPWLRVSALGLWLVTGVLPLVPGIGRVVPKGNDRALATWLATRVQSGDALVVAPVGRPTLEYYGTRQGWVDRLGSFSTFPPYADSNPAAAYPTSIDSLEAYRAQALAQRAAWTADGVTTVWCEALLRDPVPDHPRQPAEPSESDATLSANDLLYPASLVVYALVGLDAVPVSAEFRRDWMGGDRVLLAIPRARWMAVDSLPNIETR